MGAGVNNNTGMQFESIYWALLHLSTRSSFPISMDIVHRQVVGFCRVSRVSRVDLSRVSRVRVRIRLVLGLGLGLVSVLRKCTDCTQRFS